ncbi:putative RND superfamily exporter [Desulfocapsa sulfexigens DSM 10523]|uniref:Putative RND superfamily exporter n=1 Tax=Desulfocapsa sulfexigens (strain DSM 10523 / SB164P1) TaxID=1167006 RepID=M1NJP8_DESSD|nr:MMPL family transporter [Desulfocapsa sulfexigens]AGF79804.1 putative RND superfamily exporter [Desulfocapsa sulfexigens DSM 10523]
MRKIENWIGDMVIRYRWLFVLGLLGSALLSANGIRFLTFSNDSRMFFSEENPQLQALEALEKTYTKVENVLYLIAPKSGNIFERETLQAVEFLTEQSWRLPFSSRVNSLSNYQHTRAFEDDLMVSDLIAGAESLTDAEIAAIKKTALAQPMLLTSMIDKKGSVTAINVNIIKPDDGSYDLQEINDAALNLHRLMKDTYPFLDIYLTGGVMIDSAFGDAPAKDMRTLIPVMFGLLLFLIVISLRSIMATVATLLIIILSTITGLGLAGWMGIVITPASANAPIIILTLAVADSIHILVTIFHQMRKGTVKTAAIKESIRVNLKPVVITSVSTAIGFLTMNFSDAPPFRDLGNIVAMGVMAALIYSIFFMPALLAVLPLRTRQNRSEQHRIFGLLAEFVIRRRTPVFWFMIAMILFTSSGMSKIYLNDEFIKYFDTSYPFRVASDFAAEHLAGLEIIDWNLNSGEEGGINDPKYLETVDAFANWFRAQPEVRHVYTITDIMKRLNQNMHGDDPAWYKLPQERDLAAQYLLLYEMNLPFGLDLNNRINVDKSAIRMTVATPNIGTAAILDLERRGREWLDINAPSMTTYGSGLSIIFSFISKRNIDSMLKGSVIALILISLIMIVALRDIKLGILSLIPNLTPAFMAFGVWGHMVGQVGLAVSVMIAMTLGIVVDDTVHFISKYQRARKEHGMDAEDAVRYAFNTVGSAIWVTTLALVGGFGVLSFSGFQINAHMGLMTTITIIFAIILDFFFLPTLLLKLESTR